MPSIRKLVTGEWAATARKGEHRQSSKHPTLTAAERWAAGIEGEIRSATAQPAGELVARIRTDLADAAETATELGIGLEEWEELREGDVLVLIAYIEHR
jgi:hypothetical protein